MEIVEGIHLVDEASGNIAHSNVYVTTDGEKLTVVDTGFRGNEKKIVEYFQNLGFKPENVEFVVLTHYHVDHVGSATDLKELLPNAKVVAHEADAPFISGKEVYPKPKNIFFRAIASLAKPTPVAIDIAVKEGDKIGKLTVIHTPGHTPGSICLLDEQRRALFAGDALRTNKGNAVEPPDNFNVDTPAARQSIKKIAALNFDALLAGHGTPIIHDALTQVKKLAQSKR